MLIKSKKGWEIAGREVASETEYLSRRHFLKQLGGASVGGLLFGSGCSGDAFERRPDNLAPLTSLAFGLELEGEVESAIRLLERGLAAAGRGDWEGTASARVQLARFYDRAGLQGLAAQQYRLILDSSFRLSRRRTAREYLERIKKDERR